VPNIIRSEVWKTRIDTFTDVPKSTLRVQLPGFITLYTGLSGCVKSLWVQSFVSKAVLLKFVSWHWIRTRRMQLCLTPLHKMC